MDADITPGDREMLVMIDELRKRGAFHIKIGILEVAFNAATTPVEQPEMFTKAEQSISPEQLDAMLYEETLRL